MVRGSILREDVKFLEVGSSNGVVVLAPKDWLTMLGRDVEKREGGLSAYDCADSGWARDRFLAGGDTPERTRVMLLEELSPQTLRPWCQPSDSEDATREPEPVLPSMESADGAIKVLFSVKHEHQTCGTVNGVKVYLEDANCPSGPSPGQRLRRRRCSRCYHPSRVRSEMHGRRRRH